MIIIEIKYVWILICVVIQYVWVMLNKNIVLVNGLNFRFCYKVYFNINIFYKINEGNIVFIKFCFYYVLFDILIFINFQVFKLYLFIGIKKNQFFNVFFIVKGFDI